MPQSAGFQQGRGLHLIIIGGGSVEYGLGPYIDRHVVVRMKRAERDKVHRGMRMDIYFARGPHSLSKEAAAFWWFRKRSEQAARWLDFYRQFSDAKPTSGLCSLFMAADLMPGSTVGLLGFDTMLDGKSFSGPHDGYGESLACRALPLTLIDLRTEHGQTHLRRSSQASS